MRRRHALLLALVFLIGCAVGGAASHLAVPAARAQGTPKWEYFCFAEYDAEDIMAKGNQAGAQGWEMVGSSSGNSATHTTWCFKRRL
jgi:hypothetical protein